METKPAAVSPSSSVGNSSSTGGLASVDPEQWFLGYVVDPYKVAKFYNCAVDSSKRVNYTFSIAQVFTEAGQHIDHVKAKDSTIGTGPTDRFILVLEVGDDEESLRAAIPSTRLPEEFSNMQPVLEGPDVWRKD